MNNLNIMATADPGGATPTPDRSEMQRAAAMHAVGAIKHHLHVMQVMRAMGGQGAPSAPQQPAPITENAPPKYKPIDPTRVFGAENMPKNALAQYSGDK